MREKLKAVRVKLLECGREDNLTLRLYFEKVPTYFVKQSFDKKKDSVFTDFGYLEIIIVDNDNTGENQSWLTKYINDENIFIEEEVPNEITIWEGKYEDKYDWISDYCIKGSNIVIKEIALNANEWKEKYIEMTLNYCEIYFEERDKLELKFFSLFRGLTESITRSWTNDGQYNKTHLMQGFDRIEKNIQKRIEEYQAQKAEHQKKQEQEKEIQRRAKSKTYRLWGLLNDYWNR